MLGIQERTNSLCLRPDFEHTMLAGRYGSPEEDIAPVVLFLASRDAQFLTGYSLTPDGGQIIDSAR
ncbi:3-ketoacyl-(acyl-carrier-protein) reductase [compost metagenome]